MSPATPAPDTADEAVAAGETTVLVAPARASGTALTVFALQVRSAAARSRTAIDDSACGSWSPGRRLVLERLRVLAERSSHRAMATAR